MAKKYEALAQEIVRLVGGVENVNGLTHCVTRLRFKLKDDAAADKEGLQKLKEVLSVVQGNGQYQVVVGGIVEDVFDTILALYPIGPEGKESEAQPKTGNALTRALNAMAAIVNPIVIALAGAGMIKALLVVLTTTLGVLDKSGSTYHILAAAGNSVFYFLPLMLAYSSAKVFKCNPFVSTAIVAALMEPNFTGLMKHAGDTVDFLGIPVVLMGYSGTLVPAIISILIYSKVEKLLKSFIPKSIELFALSFLALLIMVPLTVIVIGPIGVMLANGVGDFVNMMSAQYGLLTGAVIGAGWTFLVMLGIHWGVVPIMINNISSYGFDVIRPMVAAATFASAGAAFGAFLKCKNKENKAFALSCTIPALLGGVTEPVVYGISLRYKKPFIAQVIGGAIAGGFMGMMHTKAIVYVFPALTTLPAFIGETFIYYVIGIALSFFITAALTFAIGFEEAEASAKVDEAPKAETAPKEAAAAEKTEAEVVLSACVAGEAVALGSVNDPVFSSEAMGKGVAIIPEEGVLYAPADGEIVAVFETGHAVGMKTDSGVELLMHIGINTVEMNGEGFKKLVKGGERVERGARLIEFDIEKIKQSGYDTTTMLIVSNTGDCKDVAALRLGEVTAKSDVLKVVK